MSDQPPVGSHRRNLITGLLGGTTPMVATYLIERSQQVLAPAVYLMGAACVALLIILGLRETYREPLRE
jgi:MHS family proline/betaine transporter-like MFS transporter